MLTQPAKTTSYKTQTLISSNNPKNQQLKKKKGKSNQKRRSDVTSAVGVELDEPGMELNPIRGSEPNILVGEVEAGRRYRVGLGETRKHRYVNELLL